MEAWAYAWLVWVFFWLMDREFGVQDSETRRSSVKTRLIWLGVASLPALVRPQWVGFLFDVFKYDQALKSGSPSSELSGTSLTLGWADWICIQCYAGWLYLRNALIPHIHSFYGPWFRGWEINHSWEQFLWPLLTVSIPTIGLCISKTRKAAVGLLVFIIPTLLLSALPRNDWYYPSRQMLGTVFFLLWLVLSWSKKPALFLKGLLLSSVSAILFAGLYQYSEPEIFDEVEIHLNGRHASPWIQTDLGAKKLARGELRGALTHFYGAHESITLSQANEDSRAGMHWSLSLYLIWLTHEKLGERDSSLVALKRLLGASFYPAGLACLQDDRVPLEFCLQAELKDNYCAYQNNPLLPRAPQVNPVRLNPCASL